jgi:septal ring factor EnvC (AmiA/AmiB activator)
LFGYLASVFIRLNNAEEDNKMKESVIIQQQNQIARFEKDIKQIKEINNNLNTIERNFQESQKKTSKYLDDLKDQDIDIIKERVNEDLKNRNRCIALATGAKAQKDEKNPNCPYLISDE